MSSRARYLLHADFTGPPYADVVVPWDWVWFQRGTDFALQAGGKVSFRTHGLYEFVVSADWQLMTLLDYDLRQIGLRLQRQGQPDDPPRAGPREHVGEPAEVQPPVGDEPLRDHHRHRPGEEDPEEGQRDGDRHAPEREDTPPTRRCDSVGPGERRHGHGQPITVSDHRASHASRFSLISAGATSNGSVARGANAVQSSGSAAVELTLVQRENDATFLAQAVERRKSDDIRIRRPAGCYACHGADYR